MFPFNSSQRAAFDGLRREFEQAIGVQPEMPRGVAVFAVSYTHLTLPTICSV